jgi:hypothetical protein
MRAANGGSRWWHLVAAGSLPGFHRAARIRLLASDECRTGNLGAAFRSSRSTIKPAALAQKGAAQRLPSVPQARRSAVRHAERACEGGGGLPTVANHRVARASGCFHRRTPACGGRCFGVQVGVRFDNSPNNLRRCAATRGADRLSAHVRRATTAKICTGATRGHTSFPGLKHPCPAAAPSVGNHC